MARQIGTSFDAYRYTEVQFTKTYQMNNKFKQTGALALALSAMALFSAQPVHAASYALRVPSIGLKSPSIAPTLGTFSVPTKPAGSSAFALNAPSSNSPGAFSYSSSNPAVATVAGNIVTITGMGTTTITAHQAASENYLAASVNASFVVGPNAGTIVSGGLTWVIPTTSLNWHDANTYCKTGTFAGWRLPTKAEASAFIRDVGGAQLTAQGWPRNWIWTDNFQFYGNYAVFMWDGQIGERYGYDPTPIPVTCVR